MVVRALVAPSRAGALVLALAGTVLALGVPAAHAAGAGPSGADVLTVQYNRQDPYGGNRYGRDREEQDRYGRDRYEQDRYRQDRYEPRRQEQFSGARGGSYQRSCGDVRQSGSTLSAVCGDGRGGRVESSIDLNRCGGSDIANIGGYLRCGNVQGSGGRVR